MTKRRQNNSIYRECIKNHAAKLGRHAVDGCKEYIPSPSSNPSDPTSLTCAACNCHRNFHTQQDYNGSYKLTDEAEEEATGSQMLKSGSGGVKRHRRSNFSREQKEAMAELAEEVEWSLKKREDGLLEEGCKRIGVEREVFKIWMHNNKKQFLACKSAMITNQPVGVSAKCNVDGGDQEQHVNNSSTPP